MLTPRLFPHLATFDALSKGSLETHLRLYQGYISKYNELHARLQTLQELGPAGNPDYGGMASVKADLTFALAAIKNHQLYFDSLASVHSEPAGALAELITKSFHSLPQFFVDLKQTAQQSRGWVWTAYDLDSQTLFNYDGAAGGSTGGGGLPVWNTVPLLAIDLYGHAYFYDFGTNKTAYVETILQNLNWPRVAERLAAARAMGR